MTTQYRLEEGDLKDAVRLWLTSHGHESISDKPARVYLGVDPGDPPLSGPTVYATAFFEVKL
jgi:hypothetical protein